MAARHLRCLLAAVAMALAAPAPLAAEAGVDLRLPSARTYLQISPNGRDDLESLFRTLEESVLAGEPQADPVIIVLHGPEALPFLRRNYAENRDIVDRAAKLQAFRRIELRMCETWMRRNGFGRSDLLPFIDTVPLAPAEVERLERDGYVSFGAAPPRTDLL